MFTPSEAESRYSNVYVFSNLHIFLPAKDEFSLQKPFQREAYVTSLFNSALNPLKRNLPFALQMLSQFLLSCSIYDSDSFLYIRFRIDISLTFCRVLPCSHIRSHELLQMSTSYNV